jgi:hypothetical protein
MSVSTLRRQFEKSGGADGALVAPIELESGIAPAEACSPHLQRDGKLRSLAGADPTGRDELERLIHCSP